MPIIDKITGWEVEEGDFIILQGTECQVIALVDDSHADYSLFTIYDMENDVMEEEVWIYLDQYYEIWGS